MYFYFLVSFIYSFSFPICFPSCSAKGHWVYAILIRHCDLREIEYCRGVDTTQPFPLKGNVSNKK